MAKANATAMNLIIVFTPYHPFEERRRPTATRGWTPKARLLRARREGKTGANRPHLRLDGGTTDENENDVG